MSETDSHSENYSELLKERLKGLAFLAVLFAIIFGINKGLWALDKILVTSIITILLPIKLFVIVFRFWQIWLLEKKIAFVLFLPIVLLLAFIFDFATVPELWAYRFGTETQGKAIEFTVKSRNSHFITYEFHAGNWVYQKEQEVTIPFYESLEPGKPVAVKYLPNSPSVAFLVDPNHLRFQTLLVLFIGLGIMLSLYANEIEKKATMILKNVFQSKRPA